MLETTVLELMLCAGHVFDLSVSSLLSPAVAILHFTCLAKMLNSKLTTEIIENHSET